MSHLLCSRCGAVVEHLVALLEHHDTVHGGWAVRYPDEKPLSPDPTRLAELLTKQARYHYSRTGRELLGKWAVVQ